MTTAGVRVKKKVSGFNILMGARIRNSRYWCGLPCSVLLFCAEYGRNGRYVYYIMLWDVFITIKFISECQNDVKMEL